MVQLLLIRDQARALRVAMMLAVMGLVLLPVWASPKEKMVKGPTDLWELSLEGGRKLSWERNFQSEQDVKPNRGFWTKVVDVIAGAPDYRFLVRPYSVATDSRGRIIVTDPGAEGVHIFDFVERKYKFIQRADKSKNPMKTPQCVAVDAQDNIYVTDSEEGMIFVFEPSGKFVRAIGSLKGGEGYFKRPTGIAVDSAAGRIYVTDTLRDQVFVLDMQGTILQTIGKEGQGDGEFNYPTEVRLDGQNLLVVDAMNFRIEAFDRAGKFEYAFGKPGDHAGAMFRAKAVSVDSEGDIYLVDSLWSMVQVFNRQGQLLYYFGEQGVHAGQFQSPTGLFIDKQDRVFVVDSFNHRIQQFQYSGLKTNLAVGGGQ